MRCAAPACVATNVACALMFDDRRLLCNTSGVAAGEHPLSTIAPTTLARAYREYLAAVVDGLEKSAGSDVASAAGQKVDRTTGDLVAISEALTSAVGTKAAPKKLSSWLAKGDRDERHRELLEWLLDRLDQELPALERVREAGEFPDLRMARQGRITKESLSPFVHHLSFSLETLQDAADLLRHGGVAVINEVEERIESVPDVLPPERGAGPGEFDDGDDFDDAPVGDNMLMALAKELLGGEGGGPIKAEKAAEPVSPFVASLIGMIEALVSGGSLELTEDGSARQLGERLADAMDQLSRQHNPPEAMVNWFVDQEDVEEVFFDGEELRAKLSELQ